jgi:hypothetical protein
MKRDEIVVRMFEGVRTETSIDYGDPVFTGTLAQVVRDNEEMLPGEPLEENFEAAVAQVEGGTGLVDFEV